MAIELNSAGWTGDDNAGNAAAQVCGEFSGGAKLDEAMSRLEGSAFQRADLSTQRPGEPHQDNVMREDDVRNLRTLGTSTAAAMAMAAAGIVVATGGAALPAVAAAVAAGGAAGVAGTVIGQVATPGGQDSAHQAADGSGGVVLMVHAASPEKQAKAEEILRDCGATRIWRQAGI